VLPFFDLTVLSAVPSLVASSESQTYLGIYDALDVYENLTYEVSMLRAACAKGGEGETGAMEDVVTIARGMREAKQILLAMKTQKHAGIADVLAETAESSARAIERLEAMRPSGWTPSRMTHT
jgi:membrane protease subunit (stomatin/prohibitin family)